MPDLSQKFDTKRASALFALAVEYHERCEAYDRTVCTGGFEDDGSVRPANQRELGLINRNAAEVRRDVERKASACGVSLAELKRAIGKAG